MEYDKQGIKDLNFRGTREQLTPLEGLTLGKHAYENNRRLFVGISTIIIEINDKTFDTLK